jgi:hypothetical protein
VPFGADKDSADAEGIHGGPSKAFAAARCSIQYCFGEHFVARSKSARIRKTQRLSRQQSLLSRMHQGKIGNMQRIQAFKYEFRPDGVAQRGNL